MNTLQSNLDFNIQEFAKSPFMLTTLDELSAQQSSDQLPLFLIKPEEK